MAHIYAHVGKLDKEHGRIYRVAGDVEAAAWEPKLARGKDAASLAWLLERLHHPYRWQRNHARQLIAEHPLRETAHESLNKLLHTGSDQVALEALWTIHLCGWLADSIPHQATAPSSVDLHALAQHASADVRAWGVRLACDDSAVGDATLAAIVDLAKNEQDPHVLSQLSLFGEAVAGGCGAADCGGARRSRITAG